MTFCVFLPNFTAGQGHLKGVKSKMRSLSLSEFVTFGFEAQCNDGMDLSSIGSYRKQIKPGEPDQPMPGAEQDHCKSYFTFTLLALNEMTSSMMNPD